MGVNELPCRERLTQVASQSDHCVINCPVAGQGRGSPRLFRPFFPAQNAILVQREGSKQHELPAGQIERMAPNEGQLVRTNLKRPRD
jgi:hypothetical protein